MARDYSIDLSPRTDGQGPAQPLVAAGSGLLLLEPLWGYLWPPERVVVGLRACKQLRKNLMLYCTSIVLVPKTGATSSESYVSKDLVRFPEHLEVTLVSQRGLRIPAISLARTIGDCKTLVHLNLSHNEIGVEGAGVLAGVLGECKSLAHIDLSWNSMENEGT
eukprot:2387604-Rhodomonas_salina.4